VWLRIGIESVETVVVGAADAASVGLVGVAVGAEQRLLRASVYNKGAGTHQYTILLL
jgi:hypothetical protein